MERILIKNGRVWDGERFFYADVLTENRKIARIAPDITDEASYIYDAAGKTVSAGLVDAHLHFCVVPADDFGVQPESACFPFGVTAAADAGRLNGERAQLDLLTLKNVIFVTCAFKHNRLDRNRLEATIDKFGDKVVGVKVYYDTSSTNLYGTEPLADVCKWAQGRGMRVMVHSTNSPVSMAELLNTLNRGDILTHAYHGGVNNSAEDNFESIMAAKLRGVVIDGGFECNYHMDFEILKKAIECGALPDIISTDNTRFSVFTRGGRYGLTTCMSIARSFGMSEEDIFRAVTANPARALGKWGEWGVLKVGGAADIAVLDYTNEGYSITTDCGSHAESDTGYRCCLCVLDGNVVYKD